MKKLLIAVLIVLLLVPVAFAQKKATQKAKPVNYTLTLQGCPSGASVSINGAPIKGTSITLSKGNYNVSISAKGYQDYSTTVNLSKNMTLSVQMQELMGSLVVEMPKGLQANIYVNGSNTSSVTELSPGTYNVEIEFAGYSETKNVTIYSGSTSTVTVSVSIR